MVGSLQPYAQALFEVAQEAHKEKEFKEGLKELASIWQSEPDFVKALAHPKIKKQEKKDWLVALFKDKIDPVLLNTLLVFNEHGVVSMMDSIYDEYLSCFRKANNIEIVKVETAAQLDTKQIQSLKEMLETKLAKTIELDIKVCPELIAGLRVQASDLVLDNSVLSRLEAIQEKINN